MSQKSTKNFTKNKVCEKKRLNLKYLKVKTIGYGNL